MNNLSYRHHHHQQQQIISIININNNDINFFELFDRAFDAAFKTFQPRRQK